MRLVSVIFSFLLAVPAQAGENGVTILFTAARQSEVEPCGCREIDLGGIDREYNAIQAVRATGRDALLFTVGTTFVPSPGAFEPAMAALLHKKAEFVAEGLKALGVSAVAPSAEDLWLGVEKLKSLRKASAPFSSANLFEKSSGKPLFEPFVELGTRDRKVYFIGLSAAPRAPYVFPEGIEVRDPQVALRAVLATLPQGPRLVVLGGSLSELDWVPLLTQFPEVHVALGPKGEDSPFLGAEQFGKSSLFMSVLDGGREMGRLDFAWKSGEIKSLRNPQAMKSYGWAKQSWSSELVALEKKLASAKGDRKRAIERDLADAKSRLDRAMAILEAPAESRVDYEGKAVPVGTDFQLPANSLTGWLEKYRSAVYVNQ